ESAMHALNPLVTGFEGHAITTFHWHGRPAWLAREVARAVGYGNHGRGLVDDITSAWADDFLPGVDYDLLSGSDLDAFRILNPDGSPFRRARSGHGLFILYESGLHLAL